MLLFVLIGPKACHKRKWLHFFALELVFFSVRFFMLEPNLSLPSSKKGLSPSKWLITFTNVDRTTALLKQETFPLERVFVVEKLRLLSPPQESVSEEGGICHRRTPRQ